MSNRAIVCTLFEGHYHYGVATLVNSLHKQGFKGDVYAGYRGNLPKWSSQAKPNDLIDWQGATTYCVTNLINIHFLPLNIDYHLTNYKPTFMLKIWEIISEDVEGMFYFDPDIIVKCNFNYYETWITYGVAVVQEIVSNNLSTNNPKRARWNQAILKCNRKIERDLNNYFNGGFCGVHRKDLDFLQAWEQVINVGIDEFEFDKNHLFKETIHTAMFPAGDQDALNVAAMCSKAGISDFGPEGMDLVPGGWLMSHATGNPKPWRTNYLLKALDGQKITQAERNYWYNVNILIKCHSSFITLLKKNSIRLCSFVNRFYSR